MNKDSSILNSIKWFVKKIIEFILRRKTLIGIIFFLIAFLVKELTALSAGDDIVSFCNQQLEIHDQGYKFYLFSMAKLIFGEGMPEVIIITVSMISLISILKFLELRNKEIGNFEYVVFLAFLFGVVLLIYYILIHPQKDDRFVLIDPLVISDNRLLTRKQKEEISIYLDFNKNLNKTITNPVYSKVIQLYREEKLPELFSLVSNTFKVEKSELDNDKVIGYVVACYFGLRKFHDAAELVLKRNESIKLWDHSLKLDLAKCIRYYSLQNGFMAGYDLVDSLSTKFSKTNILSKLWVNIPFEILVDIESGLYTKSGYKNDLPFTSTTENNLRYTVKKFPNDNFVEYGYFALQEYENCLSSNPNSRIKDIAYYSFARELIDSFEVRYLLNSEIDFYYDKVDFISPKKIENPLLDSAYVYFEKYVNEFDERPHTDDAIFWMAWIKTINHEFLAALKILEEVNMSYSRIPNRILEFKALIYRNINPEMIQNDFHQTMSSYDEPTMDKRNYLYGVFQNLNLEETIKLTKTGKVEFSYLTKILDGYYKKGNSIEFLTYYHVVDSIGKQHDHQTYSNFLSEFRYQHEIISSPINSYTFKEFIEIADEIRDDVSRWLYMQFLDSGKEYFLDPAEQEKILYRLVRNYSYRNPEYAEENLRLAISRTPKSDYIDDMYAEVIFSYYMTNYDEVNGERILNEMLEKYDNSNSNALDNALYWANIFYMKDGYSEYNPSKTSEIKSKKYLNLFFELYPNSLEQFSAEDIDDVFYYLW